MRPRRVLGYARVSSEEQARGSSLRDQQDAISAYAKAQGLQVARFYVEAESAVHEKIERREQIRALMLDVRAGDLIICDKLDRWSRDPEFTYGSIRKILEADASFYAVGDRCDPATRDGDTMLGVRVLVAREEHKRIRERMVGTRKLLRDRGYYAEGLPPFGYRRALPKGHKGAEKNVLVVEPKEAELIRRVYKLCIAGHSVAKIGRALSVGRDRVFHALRNRVYLGEVQDSRGTWLRAKHEPLVDADTFSRAQAALHSRRLGGAKPRGTPSETSDWILRDVAMCLYCGARMSAAYAGPRRARRYYYRCSHSCRARGPRRNTGSFVAVRAVEAQAEPLIVARLAELREELAREPKRDPRPVAMDFSQQREKLQRRRDKYLEAFADELISRDELRVKLGKVDSQILDIDANELASRRPKPLADPSARRVVLREVAAIRTAWGRAEPSAKRAIVGQLVTSVRVATGSDLQFVWRTAEELAQHP